MSVTPDSQPSEVALSRPPRTQQTIGDMLRTLAVVGIFIAFLAVMVWRPWQHQPIHSVDWRAAATVVAHEHVVPVLAPTSLPKGWVATSARLDTVDGGRAWQLGLVTAHTTYAAVGVTNAPTLSYLNGVLPGGVVKSGTVTIGGNTWTTFEVPGARDHALVRTDAKAITYAVYGTATYSDLTDLLGRLAPVSG